MPRKPATPAYTRPARKLYEPLPARMLADIATLADADMVPQPMLPAREPGAAHPPCPACPHSPYRVAEMRPAHEMARPEPPVSDEERQAWVDGDPFVRAGLSKATQTAMANIARCAPRRHA